MSIHDRVLAKIEAGEPRHAQATINGQLVSMHLGIFRIDTVFSGNPVVPRPQGRRSRLGYLRGMMIDHWVRGEARVSPGTFSGTQLERRAAEHGSGNGPGIVPGARDAAFAERVRAFAVQHAPELR